MGSPLLPFALAALFLAAPGCAAPRVSPPPRAPVAAPPAPAPQPEPAPPAPPPPTPLDLARGALARGDLVGAREQLTAILVADESSLPTLNLLALVHLTQSRRAARTDSAARALARATCERALSLAPDDAAIHDTLGLVEADDGEYARALAAFARARELDPTLLSPYLHAGAVRMAVRDFAGATRAFAAAIEHSPGDFDARFGLGRALSASVGVGDDAGFEARFAAARRALHAARDLAPERPEPGFSEALLLVDHASRRAGVAPAATLEEASRLLKTFVEKAGHTPELAKAMTSANRLQRGIHDALTCDFRTTERERRAKVEREIEEEAREAARALPEDFAATRP